MLLKIFVVLISARMNSKALAIGDCAARAASATRKFWPVACWEQLAGGSRVSGKGMGEAIPGRGLEPKFLEKASKIMGKKITATDFLIDVEYRKVVISNSSGNYNTLSVLHWAQRETTL